MLEYYVTRDDFESDEDWGEFIYDLNSDVNSPYYGTANVTGSYALRPGYIMSFYERGTMDALALQKMFSVIDPNDNLFPSLLEQNGLTDQYNSDVEFLSEVNRWLSELEIFLRGDQGEDDDGRFRAIEAREWRELLEEFKDGNATVRQVREFFENASYLPELEGWNDYEQEVLSTSPFRAPRTWEQVKRVLESNGYTPEEIQTIKDSIRAPGGEFQGSIVLPGILRDLGYEDAGWWDVRPASGQPCEVEGGFGTYDADGNCQDSGLTGQEGDPCGYGGTLDEYGTCVGQDYSCDNEQYASNNPGECGEQEEVDCSDPANASLPECEDKGFSDYVEEVGEGVANTAKGLYDELKDKITDCVGSPIDCIKKIGTAILESGGIPEECQDLGDGTTCGTAENPTPCWKDCVNFNLPGLPIPNIPLPPGVVDVGTYRDFENAVKTVGKTIGDIIDGNESCGPDGDQECTVGQVLEDLGEWARREWEEAIGGIDDATGQDVIDWLKGILGDVTAGIIWAEIEEEVTNVLTPVAPETKECPDPANPGQTIEVPVGTDCPPVNDTGPSPQECSNQNRTHVPGDPATQTPSSCGDCLEGFEEVGDQCQEGEDPFTNNGPTASECTTENREFNPATDVEDSSCGDCLSGFKESGDACVEDTGPDDGDGIDCNSPRPSFDGSFDSQFAGREWDRDCSATNCPTDGSLISEHPDNDCSIPIGTEVPQVGEPCDSNGDGQLDGEIDENGECVAVGGPDTPPEEEECAKPDGTPTGATVSSGCEQCPDGYTFDFDGICQPDGGSIDCAQYNREANEDGTCGGCLPGYVKDTSLPNEPCVKIFDGCPPGFELVNGECTAVACPEGQAYCESSGQCEEPQNCPGGPSEGGGGGGGGGGGFGLNLDIAEIGISGDPQLLGRQRFGQQDFLTPLFTGNQDNGADFPIARFLQGIGDIV